MDRLTELENLELETERLLHTVDEYLAEYPSARINHNRSYLLDAIRREKASLADVAAKERRVADNAQDRAARMAPKVKVKVDPFDQEMADAFHHSKDCAPGMTRDCLSASHGGDSAIGMPVEDFLAWRRRQQARARAATSFEDQVKNAPKVG